MIRLRLCLVFGLATAQDLKSKYLRNGNGQADDDFSVEEHPNRRSLAAYSIPFDFELRLKTSTNRQPNTNEYNGVSRAATEWFDASNKAYYANGRVPGLTYTSISCPVKTGATSYTANTADGYSHKVTLSCEVVFDATQVRAVPTGNEYVLNANQKFSFQNFLAQYLTVFGPASGIFRTTTNSQYTMSATCSFHQFHDDH